MGKHAAGAPREAAFDRSSLVQVVPEGKPREWVPGGYGGNPDASYSWTYTAPDGTVFYLRDTMDRAIQAWTSPPSEAGHLQWMRDGSIFEVAVRSRHQRKGLATAMLTMARALYPGDSVHHSRVLTEDGQAWSQSVAQRTAAISGSGTVPVHNTPEGYVFRGMVVLDPPYDETTKRLLEHRVTARDLLGYLKDSVGHFWGEAPDWEVASSMDHTEAVLGWGNWLTLDEGFGDFAGTGFCIVLVAKKPQGFDAKVWDWTYGERPQGVRLDLVEVWYSIDGTWRVLPAQGMQVTSGANGGLPDGLTFEHVSERGGFHVLVAHHPDAPRGKGDFEHEVGFLSWWADTKRVAMVHVEAPYRRRGVAAELWRRAKEIEPGLQHSDTITLDGREWVRSLGTRIAMPSWRNRGSIPLEQYEALIVPDTGRSSRNYFEVVLYGRTEARFTRLQQAKDFVETIYGPLQWQRIPGDRTLHVDPVWGPTTEFNDARYYLGVERLPSLAPHVAALNVGGGLYWRVHDKSRPFSPEDAISTPQVGFDAHLDTQAGYSCFENPWTLWAYICDWGWHGWVKDDDVILFSGKKRRAKGADGEDLVVPDMATVRRMSWDAFERELLTTPRPAKPGIPARPYLTWTGLGSSARGKMPGSPVAEVLWQEAKAEADKPFVPWYERTAAAGVQVERVRDTQANRKALWREAQEQGVDGTVMATAFFGPNAGAVRGTHLSIARDSRGLIGAITYSPRDGSVSDVRVDDRGQRRGVGTAMMADIAKHVLESGQREMRVYNVIGSARAWYVRLGAQMREGSSMGSWDEAALRALAAGRPTPGEDLSSAERARREQAYYRRQQELSDQGKPLMGHEEYEEFMSGRRTSGLTREAYSVRQVLEASGILINETSGVRTYTAPSEVEREARRILRAEGYPAVDLLRVRLNESLGSVAARVYAEPADPLRGTEAYPVLEFGNRMMRQWGEVGLLHEIAHLLAYGWPFQGVKGEADADHGDRWVEQFVRLLQAHASPIVAGRAKGFARLVRLGSTARTASAQDLYVAEMPLRPYAMDVSQERALELFRAILRDEGFAADDIQNAEVRFEGNGTSRASWVVEGGGGPVIPVIWLGARMRDELTLIHEAAHFAERGARGQFFVHSDADAAHGTGFMQAYLRLVQQYASRHLREAFIERFGEGRTAAIDPARQGMCYPLAFEHLMANDDGTNRLVHGTINGSTNHAWVEWTTAPRIVYDPVLDEEFERDHYYRHARAVPEQVYTPAGAERMLADTGHYGPWDGSVKTAGPLRLEGVTFTHGRNSVTAHLPNGPAIGMLSWFTRGGEFLEGIPYRAGEIQSVEVDERYRRQGVATALWEEACKVEPRLHHSPVRTDRGDAWARAVSPDAAPREWTYDPDAWTRRGRAPRRVTSAAQVRHQDGTPLDYRGKFWGTPHRLYVTEPGYDGGEGRGNWQGTPADVVAYLDYFVTSDSVYIGFMTTRDDRKRRGLASALVADLYRRYGATHAMEWGEIMDDGAEVLYRKYRSQHERTWGKAWGSRTAAWTPYPDPPGMTFREGGDAVPGGYNGWYAVFDTATGERMGYLDYQSAGKFDVTIAMVEVEPQHRRKGIATLLVKRLRHDFPEAEIDPGYSTPDGSAFLPTVRHLLGSRTASGDLVLYHGTLARHVAAIREQGLRPPDGVNALTWWMLTTSREQAASYTGGAADGVVIEYRVPRRLAERGPDRVLFGGIPHDVYGVRATVYAIKGALSGQYLTAVHPTGHTAALNTTASVDQYGGQHQPSDPDEYGAWLHDLTTMVPEDVYTRPDIYTGFRQWLGPVREALTRARGNPGARVTIYRAQPTQHTSIERGNWVTLSPQYARQHLESNVPGGHIVSAEVRADQVGFGGDDLMEWGYWGPTITGRTASLSRAASAPADLHVINLGSFLAVLAVEDGDPVGVIEVGTYATPFVANLWVRKDRRRQGLATRLYQTATEALGREIQHGEYRSPAGEAWARTLGPVPPDLKAQTNRAADESGEALARGLMRRISVTAEADTEGVMVALVPPKMVNEALVGLEQTTEPLDNQHITVVYLGDTADVDEDALHKAVGEWAARAKPVYGKVSGFGTFDNPDEKVLYAAWQIEDGPAWREGLKQALRDHGVDREDTYPMWVPHQTLAYTDEVVTDLPEMPEAMPREVVFGSIVVAYGGQWTTYPLGR